MRRTQLFFTSAVLCASLAVACASQTEKEAVPKFDKTVNVKVTKAGEVFYNKQPISLDELAAELNRLPKKTTVVCYYREAGDKEPPPITRQVIQKIIDAKLAVKLSEKECP
jgi:biopolymer transport protein ExbD